MGSREQIEHKVLEVSRQVEKDVAKDPGNEERMRGLMAAAKIPLSHIQIGLLLDIRELLLQMRKHKGD